MKLDICNALTQITRELRPSADKAGYAWVLEELADHLRELATRHVAGDAKAIDEFIDLYCLRPVTDAKQ